ncbi:MAG: hypothetical protein MH204_05955 [Fimbriimonadaceae bacterium]|nr:hypothetical protein [Fimbriimonadaceae bacterium]
MNSVLLAALATLGSPGHPISPEVVATRILDSHLGQGPRRASAAFRVQSLGPGYNSLIRLQIPASDSEQICTLGEARETAIRLIQAAYPHASAWAFEISTYLQRPGPNPPSYVFSFTRTFAGIPSQGTGLIFIWTAGCRPAGLLVPPPVSERSAPWIKNGFNSPLNALELAEKPEWALPKLARGWNLSQWEAASLRLAISRHPGSILSVESACFWRDGQLDSLPVPPLDERWNPVLGGRLQLVCHAEVLGEGRPPTYERDETIAALDPSRGTAVVETRPGVDGRAYRIGRGSEPGGRLTALSPDAMQPTIWPPLVEASALGERDWVMTPVWFQREEGEPRRTPMETSKSGDLVRFEGKAYRVPGASDARKAWEAIPLLKVAGSPAAEAPSRP